MIKSLPVLLTLLIGISSLNPSSLARAKDPPINPIPRAVKARPLQTWDFDRSTEGWIAESQCSLSAGNGQLNIQSRGDDPFFHQGVDLPGGQIVVQLRVRSRSGAMGSVFWTSDQLPHRGEDKRADFDMPADGDWLVTQTRFTAPGRLKDLRIDPGTKPGLIEIDWIKVIQEELHPLTVTSVRQTESDVQFEIANGRETAVSFRDAAKEYTLGGNATLVIVRPVAVKQALEKVSVTLECGDWPPLRRSVWVVHPQASGPWLEKSLGEFSLKVAQDGSVALIQKGDQLVASLAPLVTCGEQLPALRLMEDDSAVRFGGDGVSLSLTATGQEVTVSIESQLPCEGPAVRVVGQLRQGLFAGLEYLGKGEPSSSRLDIETAEHIRFAPDPLKVTMPLMAFVTDRVSVAMTWDDMTLQPIYATPNFFDGADDHRMTLQGKAIRTTIRLANDPLEESIAWAVKRKGLPPLPPSPRTAAQQKSICLTALKGPLQTANGWGHCVQERWARQPFADMASTLWRLSGEVPPFERYVPGGAHVPNGTIYFVTEHTQQWLDSQRQQVRNDIAQQKADGSYRYRGKYARGHFEDTASGVCALPAARLLEFAYVTGDKEALEAGIRTLDYMRRFSTPRGRKSGNARCTYPTSWRPPTWSGPMHVVSS